MQHTVSFGGGHHYSGQYLHRVRWVLSHRHPSLLVVGLRTACGSTGRSGPRHAALILGGHSNEEPLPSRLPTTHGPTSDSPCRALQQARRLAPSLLSPAAGSFAPMILTA